MLEEHVAVEMARVRRTDKAKAAEMADWLDRVQGLISDIDQAEPGSTDLGLSVRLLRALADDYGDFNTPNPTRVSDIARSINNNYFPPGSVQAPAQQPGLSPNEASLQIVSHLTDEVIDLALLDRDRARALDNWSSAVEGSLNLLNEATSQIARDHELRYLKRAKREYQRLSNSPNTVSGMLDQVQEYYRNQPPATKDLVPLAITETESALFTSYQSERREASVQGDLHRLDRMGEWWTSIEIALGDLRATSDPAESLALLSDIEEYTDIYRGIGGLAEPRDAVNAINRFRASIEAELPPYDKTSAIDTLDQTVSDITGKLRGGGAQGRAAARVVQENADSFIEHLGNDDTDRAVDVIERVSSEGGNDELVQAMYNALPPTVRRPLKRVGDPNHVDEAFGDSPRAVALRAVAELFKGMSISDIHDPSRLPPEVASVKELGGGINGVSEVKMKDGSRWIFKSEQGVATSHAEEAVSLMYRDLGFNVAMHARVVSSRSGGTRMMIFENVNDLRDDLARRAVNGVPAFNKLTPEGQSKAFDLLVANAIIGNVDRHSGNLMMAPDKDGAMQIFPIDHGHSMFYSNYPNDPKQKWKEVKPVSLYEYNVLASLGSQYIERIGEKQAADQMVAFATRMRERAAVVRLRSKADSDFLIARADWVLNNTDRMMSAIMSTGARQRGLRN